MEGRNININRDNYESFFILYIDNELSKEEQLAVEQFAALNPDLSIELEMLMQYKLEPDTGITFPAPEKLLKNESSNAINPVNYEAWLIDYLDNELSPSQRQEVEKFIVADAVAAADFSLLKQTKLSPDSNIVFPDKNLLYRSEEAEKPMPVTRWWRLAAAAVLMLAVSGTALWLNNRAESPGQENQLAVQTNGTDIGETGSSSSQNNAITPPGNPQVVNEIDARVITAGSQSKETNYIPSVKAKKILQSSAVEDNTAINTSQSKEIIVMPVAERKPAINNGDALLTESSQINRSAVVTPANTQPLYTMNAMPETTEFVDESETGKRSKLRGFFRKLTRTVEKTTHVDMTDGEDRLLVGALAIKL